MDRTVQLLLESGYGRPEDHGVLLLLGAEWSWVNTCKYLLEAADTNPFHQNDDAETALHIAIKTYSEYSDLAYDDSERRNPFCERQARICEALLKAGGAKLAHAPDKKGNVPFQMACKLGWIEAVTPMIQYGADYHQFQPPMGDTSSSWGHWAVWSAISHYDASDVPIIRHFGERGERFNSRNAAGLAPVHDAFHPSVDCNTASPILETLQALAEAGADITATTVESNETILHLFAKFCFIEDEDKALRIVQFAVERDIDIMARDKDGRTAFDVSEDQFRTNCRYSPQVLKALEKVAMTSPAGLYTK
ncbi:ankyrin repeat-containing domain protein [Coniochaeta sp. 2T2.1]|nr:ankyrin repeat-containing domain protein [Coniochaeta sp. 2T2.1]